MKAAGEAKQMGKTSWPSRVTSHLRSSCSHPRVLLHRPPAKAARLWLLFRLQLVLMLQLLLLPPQLPELLQCPHLYRLYQFHYH